MSSSSWKGHTMWCRPDKGHKMWKWALIHRMCHRTFSCRQTDIYLLLYFCGHSYFFALEFSIFCMTQEEKIVIERVPWKGVGWWPRPDIDYFLLVLVQYFPCVSLPLKGLSRSPSWETKDDTLLNGTNFLRNDKDLHLAGWQIHLPMMMDRNWE